MYIGQTGINFKTRLTEHKTSILKRQNETGIAENHSIANKIKQYIPTNTK